MKAEQLSLIEFQVLSLVEIYYVMKIMKEESEKMTDI